ncbi:rhodanese-like domain-containing protein, partial [Bacillus testis]
TNVTPSEMEKKVADGEVHVLDVRTEAEWKEGHIKGAQHIMLGDLPQHIDEVEQDKPIMVQCGSGVRSAIAASILQANGITDINNQLGGYSRWVNDTKTPAHS